MRAEHAYSILVPIAIRLWNIFLCQLPPRLSPVNTDSQATMVNNSEEPEKSAPNARDSGE